MAVRHPDEGGSRFLALTMLHNPTATDYEDVTVHLTLEYERLASLLAPLPVYPVAPFHLDAMYPEVSATKAWDLPPGHSIKTWEASPAIRGLIIGLGGHLHAHASGSVSRTCRRATSVPHPAEARRGRARRGHPVAHVPGARRGARSSSRSTATASPSSTGIPSTR